MLSEQAELCSLLESKASTISWLAFVANGIDHEPIEIYENGVRHVVVLDPDGNSLSLAEEPG